MPPKVEDCVESVLDDNPEYSESRAYAICNAQQNKGTLSVGENPTHDELLMAMAEENGDCPEGKVRAGQTCVDVEEVGVNVTNLSAPRILSQRQLAGPIERTEENGHVRYSNIKILSEGVWTDSSSGKPTHYAPENLSVKEDNAVNIMHDDGNDVSEVGEIDAESAYVENGDLYADVVLHLDNAASEYADENLQKTLETKGEKGFGGPSVEIPPQGLEIKQEGELGYPKTESGTIDGLGFVSNPAAKTTSFDRQTRERQVALSGQTDKALVLEQRNMADAETYREVLESNGIDTGDMTDEEIMAVFEEMMESAEGGEEGEEMEDDEEEEEEPEEMEEGEEEEAEEEQEMQDDGAVEAIQEQIDDLWDAMDEMKSQMADQEELSEDLESAKDELADAETVKELEEAKEELDKRLSELEEEPKNPRSLADGAEEEENEPEGPVSFGHNYDEKSGTISR